MRVNWVLSKDMRVRELKFYPAVLSLPAGPARIVIEFGPDFLSLFLDWVLPVEQS